MIRWLDDEQRWLIKAEHLCPPKNQPAITMKDDRLILRRNGSRGSIHFFKNGSTKEMKR